MIHEDPATAPARTDLPWLRHRTLRVAPTPAPEPAAAPSAAPPLTPERSSLDLPATPERSSLDLPALPTPGPPGSESVEATPVRSGATRISRPMATRVVSGTTSLLTGPTPTVTLTRVQSGVGSLSVQAACADTVGDVRIGCAYQLRDGTTSLVQRIGGPATGPPSGGRPLIRASRERFETLTVDLAQVRELQRLAVYLYSESRQPLSWSGTVTTLTYGASRIQIPLDRPRSSGVLVALTIYNVNGELVLRNENLLVPGTTRAAVLAVGYDRITWVDELTPLT